jgi:hypothetical protein
MSSEYLRHLADIAKEDVVGLKKSEKSYGDSWKKRGGVGAYMMLARKADRMENHVSRAIHHESVIVQPYDIFKHIEADERAEGLIDDIRDLRRYLMLIEAEMRARGAESASSVHRDNVDAEEEE